MPGALLLQVVQNEPLRFPESPQISEELKDLLLRMLAKVSPDCGCLRSAMQSIVHTAHFPSSPCQRQVTREGCCCCHILVPVLPLLSARTACNAANHQATCGKSAESLSRPSEMRIIMPKSAATQLHCWQPIVAA